jgi:nicotinamidase-related amidase
MNTALLVVDVQESFWRRPLWVTNSNPDIVDDVNRLVDAARHRGEDVFWILHVEPGTGTVFDPARGYVRPMHGLAPREGEPVLTKTSHNPFTTTNLQQSLVSRGINHLVVCGIRTEQCCETTARVGSDLGYAVTFVTQATATNPIPHWDLPEDISVEELLADSRTLPTDAIIARTEYALAGRFATIATLAEVADGVAPTPTEAMTGS